MQRTLREPAYHRAKRHWLLRAFTILTVLASALASAALPGASAQAVGAGEDWPMYRHDLQGLSASGETSIGTGNAAQLTKLWSYQTGGIIASGATVVSGTVYIGSWDGYEYALDATTGALKWKTYLGITNAPACYPASAGVSSTAAVQNGVVYVGGGDAYWYALDAATGAVLWRIFTGDNSATGGHYNWSSPLVYNGYAYVGIASVGDCPLVQGQILKVDLATHQVASTLNLVPNGQVGAGVWTTPVVDTATNTLYFTTGTINQSDQTLAQAMVSVNASTLQVTGSWAVRSADLVVDADWGTSPTLLTDANGRKLIAAISKNGYVYAFDRTNISAGPVWRRWIAWGGDGPDAGDGSVSSPALGGGRLYVAGNNTVINGAAFAGSVSALDPATGNALWQHGEPGNVIPALTYVNGLVIASAASSFQALDAATGALLYSYDTGAPLYAPPSVSHGIIYMGSTNGALYAFALGATPQSPPPDPKCPTGWTCQDVGVPLPQGSETVAKGAWTVTAGGAGLAGATDQFRFVAKTSAGNLQLSAQALSAQGSARAQMGLLVRQSADPGSPYYAVLVGPTGAITVQYRKSPGDATTALTSSSSALPRYLEILRVNDLFQAATSTNGSTFVLIPGSSLQLILPTSVKAGLAVTSGANGIATTARVANVALAAPTNTPAPAPTATPCASTWTCADIGNPTPVGDQSLNNGTWVLQGTGTGIARQFDQVHYVYQTVAADATLTAHITSLANTDQAAKAGVMLRASNAVDAAFFGMFVTPGNGIVVLYRASTGAVTKTTAQLAGAAPAYLQVARSGTIFTAYTSTDSVNWTPVIGASLSLPVISGTLLAGLVATPGIGGAHGEADFDTVSLTNSAPPPPVPCPAPWTCADIGPPHATGPGAQTYQNGTWTVIAAGSDIWTTGDDFHYIWQTLPADGTVSAHIIAQSDSGPWAKAGVMLRASTSESAPYYGAYVTPSNGIVVQYRTAEGAFAQQAASLSGTVPVYVRVGRVGTTFTAYTSTDGVSWTVVPNSMISLNLTGSLLAGVVVTSYTTYATSTVGFDSVALTEANGTATCPSQWTCQDIGAPAITGSQSLNNGSWMVQGAGGDIWGTADQFHFVNQTIAADGSVSAHVTGQTNTDPWAKAGVMLRGDSTTGSAYYALFITPGNGIVAQYRSAAGVNAQMSAQLAGAPPAYLEVARSGTTLTAYTSSDGVSWTPVASSSVTIAGMTGTILAGLAVTSHNVDALSSATFDSVKIG